MGKCQSRKRQRESTVYLQDGGESKLIISAHLSMKSNTKSSGQLIKNRFVIQPTLDVWVARGMPLFRPELSNKNKRIVADSWVHLRPNMFKIGKVMFNDMFDAIPMVKEMFERTKSHSKERVIIKFHVDKVMLSVDRMVAIFFNQEQSIRFMTELGERHAEQTVRIEFLDCFIPFFIMAIRPALNEKWADTIEDAWAAFFKHAIHIMKEAMVF